MLCKRRHKCLLILLIGFLWVHYASSQSWHLRTYIGSTYYQGDLAPLPIALSYSPGNLAVAFSTGMKVTDHVVINGRLLLGKLSGDDKNASDEERRLRNLNFQSALYELGLNVEFSFNKWWKRLDKHGLNFYYTTGVNVFHFNPKTEYKGELIALKPLGTEGQLLQGRDRPEPYELTQVSIPFGLGVSFRLTDRFDLGLEVAPRWTFTDYLDDVSTTYVSYDALMDCCGSLTAQLANRTGELLGSGPVMLPTGAQRGDKTDNDWYLFTGLYLKINLGIPDKTELKSSNDLLEN